MKRQYIITISFFLLMSVVTAYPQLVKLSAEFDRDSLLIGEQTKFTLRIVKEKSANVKFPVLSDTLTGKIEILQRTNIDTLIQGKDITLTQTYLITSFDSGYFQVPPLPFAIEFSDVRDTIYSRQLSLYVGKPEVDPGAEFRDIKAPVNTPLSLREILPYAGVTTAALVILTLLILLIMKRMRRDRNLVKVEVKIPSHIIALEELRKMLDDKSWEKDSIKEFYTRLSGIVRTYMEDRFNIPALETTTPEILVSFQVFYGRKKDMMTKLEELLQLSDLVKFAKEAPLPDENKRNIDKAILFVELTKPEENE